MEAVIYARQSHDPAGTMAAVDRQIEACKQYATERGWTVSDVLVDNDTSASTGKPRPQYQRLLELMRAGQAPVVLVWHIDRLTRRILDLEDVVAACEEGGSRLACVTGDIDLGTDTGRLLARILTAVARAEVERKSVRQKAANGQRARAGQARWTRRPYGYDRAPDGTVMLIEGEAEGIRHAATRVLEGATLAQVCRELNDAGKFTSLGKPWHVTGVRRVLLNERYSGRSVYNGDDVGEGDWPVILSPDVQERVSAALRDPARRQSQSVELKYLLSGTVRCGICGTAMYAQPQGKKGQRWMAYTCMKQRHLARRVDPVDDVVETAVVAALRDGSVIQLLAGDRAEGIAAWKAERAELAERAEELADLIADGLMKGTKARDRAADLKRQIDALDERIAAAHGTPEIRGLEQVPDPWMFWRMLPVRTRREIVDRLVRVTILPSGKGVRFSEDQVRITWKAAATPE